MNPQDSYQAHQRPPFPPVPTPTSRLTLADFAIPFAISMFCGFGGFAWGIYRYTQGQPKAALAAIAANVAVLAIVGVVIVLAFVLGGVR